MRRIVLRWLLPTAALVGMIFFLTEGSSLIAGRPFQLGSYSSVQFVLNTNAAALASTLGILMAIVLLMVQLTAQRYSFNIIGMFVHNPRNVALVIVFIITIVFNLWLAASIDESYVPQLGTYVALMLGTVCFGLLLPYFAYLFEILTPQMLLNRLQRDAIAAVDAARRGRAVPPARRRAAETVLHIGDITRTSCSLGDAEVARHSIWILYGTFCRYLERKPDLPPDWFTVEDRFFRGRHALIVKEIEESGTWLERRLFEEFQSAFTGSLNRLEPVNTTVALCCRLSGEQALERGDEGALRLLIKFFNTFLRAALNARDARAGYHLLYQYALLADAAFESRPDLAIEIAHRIAYYGETAIAMGVMWVAIAAAQDLRSLAEASVRRGLPRETTAHLHEELLDMLAVAERKKELRGSPTMNLLQKTVLALGAYHLDSGDEELARELARGLRTAYPSHLARLARDLEAVTEPQFWELTDRAVNFEYLEEGPRGRLADFVAIAAADSSRDEDSLEALEVAD